MNKAYHVTLEKSLNIHMQTLIGMTVVTFGVEIIFFFILSAQGLIEASTPKYFGKYVFLPTGINAICTIISWCVCHSQKASIRRKQYTVSLFAVCVTFVIAITHGFFSSVYLLFAFVIIFTVFYGDKYLTTVVFFASLAGRCISATCCIDQTVIPREQDLADLLISVIILCSIYVLSLTIIRLEIEKRELLTRSVRAWAQLREESKIDNLTGLFNRQALQEYQDELRKLPPSDCPGYIAMWDVDNFKQINDTYGHLQGDAILEFVGKCCFEEKDHMVCFRYGGDEFCAALFSDDQSDTEHIIKNIQKRLGSYTNASKDKMDVSISVGVTKYTADISEKQLISRADQALYCAKRNAKGSIVFSTENETFC